MKSPEEETAAISSTGRGLRESLRLRRLLNMLRNMWRNYPTAKVLRTSRGVFGVLLDERHSISVFVNGNWRDEELRDCLALFAMWCVVDRQGLLPNIPHLGSHRRTSSDSSHCVG